MQDSAGDGYSKSNIVSVRKFGVDPIILESRAMADEIDECSCLMCNPEKISIDAKYAIETIRLLRSSLISLIGSQDNIADLTIEMSEAIENDNSEEWERLNSHKLVECIHEFENAVETLNCTADACLPWAVWYACPEKRVERKKPPALKEVLSLLQFADFLQTRLRSGGDWKSGGDLWNLLGVKIRAEELVVGLERACDRDPRLTSAAVADPICVCKQPQLSRLERLNESKNIAKQIKQTVVPESKPERASGLVDGLYSEGRMLVWGGVPFPLTTNQSMVFRLLVDAYQGGGGGDVFNADIEDIGVRVLRDSFRRRNAEGKNEYDSSWYLIGTGSRKDSKRMIDPSVVRSNPNKFSDPQRNPQRAPG